MTASGPKSLSAIGFLTVVEDPQLGLFGGYLVLNAAARPLEFHCTAPVKANRAQEILYGPTLAPYLYGEQIGKTLIDKAKAKPMLVCTDVEPAMSVRELISMPVLLITAEESVDSQHDTTHRYDATHRHDTTHRIDAAHQDIAAPKTSELSHFHLGDYAVAAGSSHQSDQHQALTDWQTHFNGLELLEPFSRIREAIEEAQRSAR